MRITPIREPRMMPAKAPTERLFELDGAGDVRVEVVGDELGLAELEREILVAANISWSLGKS